MTEFETLVLVERESVATVLIAALRAHGFHPRDLADGGLPGLARTALTKGIPIEVPAEEVREARPLAEALLKDMEGR